MSGLANPRKNFRYVLEIDGLNAFLVQEVQAPTVEYPEIQHGAPGNIPNAKTPDKMKVGDMVIKKLCPALRADPWAWEWFGFAMAGIKKDFIKPAFLKHLAPDAVTSIQTWYLGDCWVKKIEPSNLMSVGGENFIETLTLAPQFYVPKEAALMYSLLAGSAARAGGAAFRNGFN